MCFGNTCLCQTNISLTRILNYVLNSVQIHIPQQLQLTTFLISWIPNRKVERYPTHPVFTLDSRNALETPVVDNSSEVARSRDRKEEHWELLPCILTFWWETGRPGTATSVRGLWKLSWLPQFMRRSGDLFQVWPGPWAIWTIDYA